FPIEFCGTIVNAADSSPLQTSSVGAVSVERTHVRGSTTASISWAVVLRPNPAQYVRSDGAAEQDNLPRAYRGGGRPQDHQGRGESDSIGSSRTTRMVQ